VRKGERQGLYNDDDEERSRISTSSTRRWGNEQRRGDDHRRHHATPTTPPQQDTGRNGSWSHVTCPTTRENRRPCRQSGRLRRPLQRRFWRLPVAHRVRCRGRIEIPRPPRGGGPFARHARQIAEASAHLPLVRLLVVGGWVRWVVNGQGYWRLMAMYSSLSLSLALSLSFQAQI
jgi:hypothetical protein